MQTAESHTRLIAVTGGPCSGKTSLFERLNRSELAEHAVFVPEAASLVLPGYLAVKDTIASGNDSQWQNSLQYCITRLQYELEETYARYAEATGKQYVICDRGLRDAEAYTKQTDQLYKSIGHTATSALLRYSGVLHLESLAIAEPDKYSNTTNPNRYESLLAAQELEYRTRRGWEGHPNWHFIPGYTDAEDKFYHAKTVLKRIMGVVVEA